MAGKETKVYEYFKTDEMFFYGKHREYIDKLWVQNKIQESYFKRLVDLYAIAAIVGLKTNRMALEERDDTELKRTVQLKQLSENYQTLINIMRLILVMDETRGISMDERLESAFTIPEDEETYKKNMELFNSYARGGIEYLYENLVIRTPDVDDKYADFRISNIVSLINNSLDEDVIV